jgi:hypothetical protein
VQTLTATDAVQNPALGPTIDPAEAARLAVLALDEDLAGGADITTLATVPSDQVATADVVARADGVVAGLPIAAAVFAARPETTAGIELAAADGDRVRRVLRPSPDRPNYHCRAQRAQPTHASVGRRPHSIADASPALSSPRHCKTLPGRAARNTRCGAVADSITEWA